MPRRKRGGGAVLFGAAVVALFLVAARLRVAPDGDDGHRLRRPPASRRGRQNPEEQPGTDACRGPRAFPQEEGMPWRLYDAFTTDCRIATFVAQYERGCEEMAAIMERAAGGDIQAWLDTAKAKRNECKVCAVHAFEKHEAPKVEAEKKRVFDLLGGPTKDLVCTFPDATGVQASSHRSFHAKKSTLVFHCPIPPHVRCENLEVALSDTGRTHDAVRVCPVTAPKVDVAAVAWTSSKPYTDRAGQTFANDSRVLRRWLAWHWSQGVRYFLIYESGATWAEPRSSELWPAVGPFVKRGAASLVPWATDACRGPHVRLEAGQRGGVGLTDFFGRPSQYAAQNAGLYRLRDVATWVAFLDVDELLIPETTVSEALAGETAAASVPHVFYGRCPGTSTTTCAGKAVPSRNKLITNHRAVYVWDHALVAPPRATRTIQASTLRLAHLRADYSFATFDGARFGTRGNRKEARAYLEDVLPYVNEPCPGSVACEGVGFCWCRDRALEGKLAGFREDYRKWYNTAGDWEVM
jgi:hypothetical protein